MEDTKIIGRINCKWEGDSGSDSSPVFENDTHEFNADALKVHMLELATGNTKPGDMYTYSLYDSNHELRDCTLIDLFKATHKDARTNL